MKHRFIVGEVCIDDDLTDYCDWEPGDICEEVTSGRYYCLEDKQYYENTYKKECILLHRIESKSDHNDLWFFKDQVKPYGQEQLKLFNIE